MASLTRKRGSLVWIACFTDATGVQRQRSTGVRDEGEPQTRADNRRKALDIAQTYETAARGDRTEAQIRKTVADLFNKVSGQRLEWASVRPFLTSWLDRAKVRKAAGTHRRYETVINAFLQSLGTKAEKALGDVSTNDVQEYLDLQTKAGKRAGTLRIEAKILNAVFAHALRQGLVILNPVPAVDLPTTAGESKRPFTWKQVRAIIGATDAKNWEAGDSLAAALPDWKTAIMVAAFTGARLGDTVNLRWRNIDLEGQLITFRPSKTKAQAKDVVIPLHPALEAHILTIEAADNPEAFLMPSLAGKDIGGRGGLSRQFQRILAVAGIENEELGESGLGRAFQAYGFHSLRHTFNTVLADSGVSAELRKALSGHSSDAINELYTHRGIGTLREAVKKMPAL